MKTGQFPEDLKNYSFKYKNLVQEFFYQKVSESDFSISFSVGTLSTSHYYRHSQGKNWEYYDD
jgi:hypothetical protein